MNESSIICLTIPHLTSNKTVLCNFSVQIRSGVILCVSQILQIDWKDMRTLFTLTNHSLQVHSRFGFTL